MSKPIDFKTAKIYEHLKKKPSSENKAYKTLNSESVYAQRHNIQTEI